MAASRKSTPRRARSSSVASDKSAASSRSPASAKESTNTPKKDKKAPATPRRSKAKSSTESNAESTASASKPASAAKPASASKPASAAKAPSSKKGSAAAKPASSASKAPTSTTKAPSSASKPRKPALTQAQKRAIAERPPLPKEGNAALPAEPLPVKLQVINREGADIIIGRVKLPTTVAPFHGFILRRFDTNAIAASAMFRLAFPHSSASAEASEMEYIEKRYEAAVANGGLERIYKKGRARPAKKTVETALANGEELEYEDVLPKGSSGVRLQGTWVPCTDALDLAKEYGLELFAQPLIEAEGAWSPEGMPILTPSKNDHVSVATIGKTPIAAVDDSPSKVRQAKRSKDEASAVAAAQASAAGSGLSAKEIEKQIKESQALAKGIQSAGKSTTPTTSRKRRATHQSPSAHGNALDDADDYEHSSAVVRSLRRTTRAARRRPLATTASALGAAGAVGAGALAYLSGGNLDVATQLVQQGIQNLGQWFFF